MSRKESMIKSIIWRILGVFILAAVTYYFTQSRVITSKITVTHHAFFLVVFYLHERLWERIKNINLSTSAKRYSIIKSFTYEIILGMGFGGLIVYLFTGEWLKVGQITLSYTAIKLVMYYLYDQL